VAATGEEAGVPACAACEVEHGRTFGDQTGEPDHPRRGR
jgi:hypothetical protein